MTRLPHDGRVRFHAYLDPGNQWVIGRVLEMYNGIGQAGIFPLRGVNDNTSLWSPYYINETQFRLRWVEAPHLYLMWGETGDSLGITSEEYAHGNGTLFTIDDLDPSPWFALNNFNKSRVADISESMMAPGRYVITFPWNGGDNQKWRFEAY